MPGGTEVTEPRDKTGLMVISDGRLTFHREPTSGMTRAGVFLGGSCSEHNSHGPQSPHGLD